LSVLEASKTQLHREVEILGIARPKYIKDSGYTDNFLDVAMQTLPGIKDGTYIWTHVHSTRKASQLDNARSLGYPVGTNVDLEGSLLLHFDYQSSQLEVFLTSVGTMITIVEGNFRIKDFGGVGQDASVRSFLSKLDGQLLMTH
jgi:hypothetical protein